MFAYFTFHIAGEYLISLTVGDAAGNFGSRSTDNFTVTVLDITSPVAVAGNDTVIEQHQSLIFNGSLSYDNIMIADYTWNFSYKNRMRYLSGSTTGFNFDDAGIYIITLNVTDSEGNWGQDSFQLKVNDITNPIANPGADFWTENIGDAVSFNARYSSDNVGIVNYTWSFNYNATLHHLYGVEVSFNFYRVQIINVTLTVTDAEGNWNNSICSVRIIDTIPPVAAAGLDLIVDAGTNVTLNANGTWDHSRILSYVWVFTYDDVGRTLTGINVDFRFEVVGTYSVLLIVRDIWENAATDTVTIEVRDLSPPVIEAANDMNITSGETAFLNVSAWDNIGITKYEWRFQYNDSEEVLNGKSVSFLFNIPGNYTVNLSVHDEAGNTAKGLVRVNVTTVIPSGINETPDDDEDLDDELDDDSDNDDDIDLDDDDGVPQGADIEKGSSLPWFWILTILLVLIIIIICMFLIIKHRSADKSESPTAGSIEEMEYPQPNLSLPEDEKQDKLSSDESEKTVLESEQIDSVPSEEIPLDD